MSPSPGRITHRFDTPFSRRYLQTRDARAIKSDADFIRMREEILAIVQQREH
jgi:taurine transport system ATP-binding protein